MNTTETKPQENVVLQASNIDEQGNVLYLDQERLDRKEMGLKRFRNKRNGLGIFNFLKTYVFHLNDKTWPLSRFMYNTVVKYAKWVKQGGIKASLYRRAAKIAPHMEKNTGSIVMPLNVDVTEASKKVVIPMDMLKETLKKVEYIAGMDTCLCRYANGCTDYPLDLGCLFLGEPGRSITKHNLGRVLTYEEACARIDRAAELGLMAQAVWIEFEQIIWGVRNDQMDNFLEVCFCCPCCCVGMQLSRQLPALDRSRFHPSGWTAVPDRTKCVGCGKCATNVNGCPVEAIRIGEDKKVIIDQETCVGCGICKSKCNVGAISIKQTMPMRADIGEYFDKEFNIGLAIWKDTKEE